MCGSVAHADPSSEIPLALAVAGGTVVLRSQRGERVLAAEAFQQDMLTTARAPDELIAAVRFPVIEGKGVAFDEVARRHGDFAIIALAAIADQRGAVTLGVGGMAGRPMVRSIDGDAAGAIAAWARGARRLRGLARLGGAAARSPPQSRAAGGCGGDPMRRLNKNDRVRIALTLNGRKLAAEAEPRTLLSDFLRQGLGATGTHVGCEHGICGACTVLIDGVATRSCLTLAVQAEGREVQNRGIACRARRRAQSAADGVPRPSRAAMRLLHAGHFDVVHRLSSPAIRIRPPPKSAKCSPATSAAAPAMPASSRRWRRWRHHPPPRKRGRGTARSGGGGGAGVGGNLKR